MALKRGRDTGRNSPEPTELPAALVLFGGELATPTGWAKLAGSLRNAGFRVVVIDVKIGGENHDLRCAAVRSALLRRVRSGEFAFIFAGTPCAPYSIARGGVDCPPLHTADGPVEPCPIGWEIYRAEHDQLLDFTCEIFRAGDSVGAACMLENPADVSRRGSDAFWFAKSHHGSIFKTKAIRALCLDIDLLSVDFAQCSFGGAYRKWTCILYSRALLQHIGGWRHLGCAHGLEPHADVAYGRDEWGAAKSAIAASYPPAMDAAIAAIAAAFLAERRASGILDAPGGVGRAADGPGLSPVVRAACEAAALAPPRFSSFRNLSPAGDEELRNTPLPEMAPPSPPVPRRLAPLTNPWPPGWEARRPISIEQLHRPGVYEAFELWLGDGEVELILGRRWSALVGAGCVAVHHGGCRRTAGR